MHSKINLGFNRSNYNTLAYGHRPHLSKAYILKTLNNSSFNKLKNDTNRLLSGGRTKYTNYCDNKDNSNTCEWCEIYKSLQAKLKAEKTNQLCKKKNKEKRNKSSDKIDRKNESKDKIIKSLDKIKNKRNKVDADKGSREKIVKRNNCESEKKYITDCSRKCCKNLKASNKGSCCRFTQNFMKTNCTKFKECCIKPYRLSSGLKKNGTNNSFFKNCIDNKFTPPTIKNCCNKKSRKQEEDDIMENKKDKRKKYKSHTDCRLILRNIVSKLKNKLKRCKCYYCRGKEDISTMTNTEDSPCELSLYTLENLSPLNCSDECPKFITPDPLPQIPALAIELSHEEIINDYIERKVNDLTKTHNFENMNNKSLLEMLKQVDAKNKKNKISEYSKTIKKPSEDNEHDDVHICGPPSNYQLHKKILPPQFKVNCTVLNECQCGFDNTRTKNYASQQEDNSDCIRSSQFNSDSSSSQNCSCYATSNNSNYCRKESDEKLSEEQIRKNRYEIAAILKIIQSIQALKDSLNKARIESLMVKKLNKYQPLPLPFPTDSGKNFERKYKCKRREEPIKYKYRKYQSVKPNTNNSTRQQLHQIENNLDRMYSQFKEALQTEMY